MSQKKVSHNCINNSRTAPKILKKLYILEEAYTISQHNCQDMTVIYVCPCRNMMRPICGNTDDTSAPLPHQNGNEYLSAPASTLRVTRNWKVPNLRSKEGAVGRPNHQYFFRGRGIMM